MGCNPRQFQLKPEIFLALVSLLSETRTQLSRSRRSCFNKIFENVKVMYAKVMFSQSFFFVKHRFDLSASRVDFLASKQTLSFGGTGVAVGARSKSR